MDKKYYQKKVKSNLLHCIRVSDLGLHQIVIGKKRLHLILAAVEPKKKIQKMMSWVHN